MHLFSHASIVILSLATSACAAPSGPVHTLAIRQANDYLNAHNSFRAQHGADPLTWSAELEAKAQNWANGCKFEHGSTGENLAVGTGDFSATAAVKLWTDEIDEYDPNNPQPSHFTQVDSISGLLLYGRVPRNSDVRRQGVLQARYTQRVSGPAKYCER
ncbi:hypothetical protein FRC11_013976 [Ceratobasidium sp. 423]|nr:hypothetical protein FRC11_013976 [Ceratobasidium sp. 423]